MDIVAQSKWGAHDGPGTEVSARLLVTQSRVVGATRAVGASDLKHIGVRPAARV